MPVFWAFMVPSESSHSELQSGTGNLDNKP